MDPCANCASVYDMDSVGRATFLAIHRCIFMYVKNSTRNEIVRTVSARGPDACYGGRRADGKDVVVHGHRCVMPEERVAGFGDVDSPVEVQ